MIPQHAPPIRTHVGLLVLLAALVLGAGCKDDVCRQMLSCCEASAELEGVGSACGDLAQGVRDPATCRTILKTVRFVYEDEELEVPAVCLPAGAAQGETP